MSKLKELLKNGFMTSNSTPSGEYSVKIELKTLKEVHLLHRELIAIRQGNTKLKIKE